MQVQTVPVIALLVVEEKLAKFRRPERRPDHAVVQHELVNGEDGDGALTSRVKSEVGGIARTTSCSVVYILCIHDNFLQIAILSKVLDRLEFFLGSNLWCDTNHIDKCLLYDSQIGKLFDLISG